MLSLILDVKIYIASYDEEVWYQMYLYDDEVKEYTKLSILYFKQLFTKPIIIKDYWTEYRLLGYRHRDGDQPAFIYANGTKVWYQNGQRHRDGDQPAFIYADGSKQWYQKGQRHRDGDQPAI